MVPIAVPVHGIATGKGVRMIRARRIAVLGQVQGVGFRAAARAEARRLRLTGFARNEADGSVMMEVEGDADAVKTFIAWCHRGPSGASVSQVDVEASEPLKRPDFSVG